MFRLQWELICAARGDDDPERVRGGAEGDIQGEAGEVPLPRAAAAGGRDPARPRPPQRAPPLHLVPRRRESRPRPRVCGPWRALQGPSRRWPLRRAHGRHCKNPPPPPRFPFCFTVIFPVV